MRCANVFHAFLTYLDFCQNISTVYVSIIALWCHRKPLGTQYYWYESFGNNKGLNNHAIFQKIYFIPTLLHPPVDVFITCPFRYYEKMEEGITPRELHDY